MRQTPSILLLAIIGFFCAPLAPINASSERPNFIIIFNDDQGYQDLGCFGSPTIKTPRLDQMAKDGLKLTDFYVPTSVCSPSRAALLTGYYPQRVGVSGVYFPNRPGGLDPKHVTIAETLKTVGYATAAVGKWHLGDQPRYLPTNQGFDSYFGIPYSNDMFPAKDMTYAADCLFREGESLQTLAEAFSGELKRGNPMSMKDKVPLMRGTECVEFPADQRTITRRFADEGIKFITESVESGKPFFLYLANSMPHVPLFASEDFEGKSEGGLYGDTIEEIDFNTGRVLDHLEATGVAENTIVVFTSDNGPWLVQRDKSGSALPLFEGKFSSFEGGCRVPCIIQWPKVIPPGSISSEVVSTIDLYPTFSILAGVKKEDIKVDGKDIFPILSSPQTAKSPHEYLFMGHRTEAVRSGPWKYHHSHVLTVGENRLAIQKEPILFNLENDISETTNVIDEYPEVAARLEKKLRAHFDTVTAQ